MNIEHEPDRDLYWLVGIHLTFVVSTLVLALSGWFGSPTRTHPTATRKTSGALFLQNYASAFGRQG